MLACSRSLARQHSTRLPLTHPPPFLNCPAASVGNDDNFTLLEPRPSTPPQLGDYFFSSRNAIGHRQHVLVFLGVRLPRSRALLWAQVSQVTLPFYRAVRRYWLSFEALCCATVYVALLMSLN